MDKYAARWGIWAIAMVAYILIKYVFPPIGRKLKALLDSSRGARIFVAILAFLLAFFCLLSGINLIVSVSGWGLWMGIATFAAGAASAFYGYRLLKK